MASWRVTLVNARSLGDFWLLQQMSLRDSVHWLPCCSRVELCHFISIPLRLRLLDLPACVQTVRHRVLLNIHRERVIRSLLERHTCSVTRWYYETSVGGYSVYTGYHIFLAALYLTAEVSYDNVVTSWPELA